MARSDVLRESINAKITERQAAQAALEALRALPDADVTAEQITTATAARDAFDAQIDALTAERAAALAEEQREDAINALQRELAPNTGPRGPPAQRAYDSVIRTGDTSEPRTYTETTNQHGRGVSFFKDAYRAEFKSDHVAAARLDRHANEVQLEQREQAERASSTSSYAGLVVPQYLTDMVAPVIRFGRPLANICNSHQLPDRGMQLIIPRGTTGASTAIQATENTAVSSTDEVLANLTVPVVTIAGQQDVSRQSLERGEMIDSFIYGDLARAYAANLDNQVINGSGSSGQMLGIVNTASINAATAFGAAVTVTNFNLKMAGQITAVTSTGAGIFPTCIVMHPRRWGWLMGQVDSTGRPVVQANNVANFNAVATVSAPGQISADPGAPESVTGVQFVGMHSSGLPVLTDLNMPTAVGAATGGEDLVFASCTREYHLWEEGNGAPTELRFEQTTGGSLTTKLVVYGYSAFTAGRYPGATGKIGGLDTTTNGLVAPLF
jgi:HK97 family phage major capsid protein